MRRICFNDGWEVGAPVHFPSRAAHEYEKVRLPHDAMIRLPRNGDSGYSFQYGSFVGTNVEYVKRFPARPEWRDRYVLIEFEGVYTNSSVFLNGSLVARQPYGYTRFTADLTPYLREGENELRVTALGAVAPNSRWYPGTGIYRDVYLLLSERDHIAPYGLRIATDSADRETAAITLTVDAVNGSGIERHIAARMEIVSPNGDVVAQATIPYASHAGATACLRQHFVIAKPSLWSVDTPALYTARATLLDGDTVLDSCEDRFGIRTIELDALRGLRINGESVKLRGGCIHHDNGPIGSAEFPAAARRRVRFMKQAGYNAIRSSHNPMSPALLNACDELGMLVMDESFDTWNQPKTEYDYNLFFSDWWQRDTRAMIDKDYNHPCVIFYSIGNEISERDGLGDGGAWVRRQAEYIRSLDPSRPVASAICGISDPDAPHGEFKHYTGEKGFAGVPRFGFAGPSADYFARKSDEYASGLDVLGMNYLQRFYADQSVRYPHRVLCGTESMVAQYAEVWGEVEKRPNVIGDFCWTAWEYLGEAGCGKIDYKEDGNERALKAFMGDWPWVMAYCGDFDLTGARRTQSYYREIVWHMRKAPYIAVQRPERHGQEPYYTPWSWSDTVACWTWPGFEGRNTDVEVYGDADEIELFVNGRSLGRQPVNEFCARWTVAYEPGTIKAIAYTNGTEVGCHSIATVGRAERLALEADTLGCDGTVKAGGGDVAYVRVSLLDGNGNHAFGTPTVRLHVEGAAELIGFGSADPCTDHDYFRDTAPLFDGTAIAILCTTTAPGPVRITADAEGLKGAELCFKTV